VALFFCIRAKSANTACIDAKSSAKARKQSHDEDRNPATQAVLPDLTKSFPAAIRLFLSRFLFCIYANRVFAPACGTALPLRYKLLKLLIKKYFSKS
jgi:hypothetical protein